MLYENGNLQCFIPLRSFMTALSICRHVCMLDICKNESAVEQVFAGFPLKVMRRYSGLGRELHRYVAWKGTIRTGKCCNGLR